MHDIEPFYNWRHRYIASEDSESPFYGREYDEFAYSNKIYNYYIHPQWDGFGSPTLYSKILYADYDERFAVIEFIGEWNDCVTNDVMHLKRNVIDHMIDSGITRFALICENVLNFHGSDECYYEEWRDDVIEQGGWIAFINTLDHVEVEMRETGLSGYVFMGDMFTVPDWRGAKPQVLIQQIEEVGHTSRRYLAQ
jgi:hypothetical protein